MGALIAASVVLLMGAAACLLPVANRVRVAFGLVSQTLATVLVLMAWQGALFAQINGAQSSPAFEIPMAIPYASLPLCAVLMLVQLVLARLSGTPAPVSSGEGDTMISDTRP
jgi:TRAP-type C4-dicarboxylate transport system permease small subunit